MSIIWKRKNYRPPIFINANKANSQIIQKWFSKEYKIWRKSFNQILKMSKELTHHEPIWFKGLNKFIKPPINMNYQIWEKQLLIPNYFKMISDRKIEIRAIYMKIHKVEFKSKPT